MSTQDDFGRYVTSGDDELDAKIIEDAANLPEWDYDAMIAVINFLAANNISYEWKRGAGHVDLTLEDGTSIELVPDAEHPQNVGRTLRNGIGHYLMTDRRDGNNRFRTLPPESITPQQAVSVVADALGMDTPLARGATVYTNRGASRYVELPPQADGTAVRITEQPTDVRRHQIDEMSTPEPDAMERLRTISSRALDNAMGALNVDRLNDRIGAAIAISDGERTPADEADQRLAGAIDYSIRSHPGDTDPVRRRLRALAILRQTELEADMPGDPTIHDIAESALNTVRDSIMHGTYDPAEPLMGADAEGVSGYDRISGLEPLMDADRMDEGLYRPDLVAHYSASSSFGNVQMGENARARALGRIMSSAGIDASMYETLDDRKRPSSAVVESMTTVFHPDREYVPVDEVQAGHQRDVMARIERDLHREGITPTSVRMDDQGVVMWEGDRTLEYRGTRSDQHVAGLLGQINLPDRHGAITTHFAGGNDFMLAPGARANILPDDRRHLNLLRRTRLQGYMQQLNAALDATIHDDTHSGEFTGSATALNSVVTHAEGVRHPVDFLETYHGAPGMAEAILETETRRIHYPSRMASTTGIMATMRARLGDDYADRRQRTDQMLTHKADMSVIDDPAPGYLDPVITTNGDVQQGLVRYLAADAVVNEDGSITPAVPGGRDRAPIYYADPSMAYSDADTFDRTVMASMNLIHSVGLSEPTGVEQASLGGWTFDDAIVVTNRFARDNPVPRNVGGNGRVVLDAEGRPTFDEAGNPVRNPGPEIRRVPLTVGDKISDHHGNKGVISKVVDVDDPDGRAKAEREGWLPLYDHVAAAARNGTDVFMAPFSAVSRFNAGSAREIMDNGGKARFIISENTAQHKTVTYGDEGSASSNKIGRSASAQLGWSLQAHGCDAIMRELYGGNDGLEQSRAYLQAVGLDISDDGTLSDRLDPGIRERAVAPSASVPWNGSATPMLLPFALTTPVVEDPGGVDEHGETVTPRYATTDVLPVLSSDIRDHSELTGDGRVTYAFDRNYQIIHDSAARYSELRDAIDGDARLKAGEPGAERIPVDDAELQRLRDEVTNDTARLAQDPERSNATFYRNRIARDTPVIETGYRLREPIGSSELDAMREEMQECERRAQTAYDSLAGQIVDRKLTGKHNVFKEHVLSHEVPHSATAVWTPDPRLPLDTIAVSPALLDQLGLKDGDPALAWRDPILTTGGVHCFSVKADPGLTGFAVNPVMDEYFDGDFDGDTLALVGLQTDEARAEAKEKLSLAANLTNPLKYDSASGTYDLAVNTGLDMEVGCAPQNGGTPLKTEYQRLRAEANTYDIWDKALDNGLKVRDPEATRKSIREHREALVDRLDDLVHRTLDNSMGKAVTDFSDVPHHVASVASNCLMTGAKGSPSKLANYAHYLGADIDDAFMDAVSGYDPGMTPTNDAKVVRAAREAAGHPDAGFTSRMNPVGVTLRKDQPTPNALPGTYDRARAVIDAAPAHIHDTVEPDPSGRHLVKRDHAADRAVNFATATKAFGTGVAGKVSQRAMVLTRGTPIMGDTLNLSSRATQGTLQIKHDAGKAVTVMTALLSGSKSVWNGRAVTWDPGDKEHAPSWVAELHTPTMQEWEASTMNYYGSNTGIGASVDGEALHRLADHISLPPDRQGTRKVNTKMFDPLSDVAHMKCAPIDLLAYGPDARSSMDAVTALAHAHANIYAGAGAPFKPDRLVAVQQADREAQRHIERAAAPTAPAAQRSDPWAMGPSQMPTVDPFEAPASHDGAELD